MNYYELEYETNNVSDLYNIVKENFENTSLSYFNIEKKNLIAIVGINLKNAVNNEYTIDNFDKYVGNVFYELKITNESLEVEIKDNQMLKLNDYIISFYLNNFSTVYIYDVKNNRRYWIYDEIREVNSIKSLEKSLIRRNCNYKSEFYILGDSISILDEKSTAVYNECLNSQTKVLKSKFLASYIGEDCRFMNIAKVKNDFDVYMYFNFKTSYIIQLTEKAYQAENQIEFRSKVKSINIIKFLENKLESKLLFFIDNNIAHKEEYANFMNLIESIKEIFNYFNILKEYRQKIDFLDSEIISLLDQRFRVIQYVSEIKKKHDISIMQNERVNTMIKKRQLMVKNNNNITSEFIKELYKLIIKHSMVMESKHITDML
ncbi:chorismate mutase [Clostridium taeniosporum]|uniref:Chorismate mutase domain-containing protein n=1 Tax=Clostridium taeniosporum TaxID=394958 RepID=A0A1D7XH23_9CLOT|nr:chorismate mutase [Clostridium taeniosporum]AOR22647.1 hypothetical protein BGI42_02515 [Clostridium taeniosporum]